MGKLIVLFLLFPCMIDAQEKFNWVGVNEIKFYDLISSNCGVDSLLTNLKSVTVKTSEGLPLLQGLHEIPRDVAKEKTCYLIVVKFENGESIPLQLYPEQMAAFDARKNHRRYLFFNDNDSAKMEQLIQGAVKCLKDPACKASN